MESPDNEYDYEVTETWAEMLTHFNTTVWPEFQTRGFDDAGRAKVLELFMQNRMYNMLETQLDSIIQKLMLIEDRLRGR